MSGPQMNTAMRIYMVATAAVGASALLLQFPLSIAISCANGMTLGGAVITYFSFFTILTNLAVVVGLALSFAAPDSDLGRFASRPEVVAGLGVSIAIVGTGYSLLLRNLWAPEGLQLIVDFVLHDLVPLLYVAYWLLFVPKRGLRWKSVPQWLTYPLAYFGFVLLRGAISGRYPYPFIDAGAVGYPRVFFNAALLLLAFTVVGLVAVGIGRCIARFAPSD